MHLHIGKTAWKGIAVIDFLGGYKMEQKSLEKMGSVPIKKLMVSMGLLVIFSMMLQALYNIVDSAFVSNMEKMLCMRLHWRSLSKCLWLL